MSSNSKSDISCRNDNNDKSSCSGSGNDDSAIIGGLGGIRSSNNNNNTNNSMPSPVISEPKTPQEGIFSGLDQLAQQDR